MYEKDVMENTITSSFLDVIRHIPVFDSYQYLLDNKF